MNKTALIRCDAAPAIGFGHVVRCLAMADELRDRHGWMIHFAMVQGADGIDQVERTGYAVHRPIAMPSSGCEEGEWLRVVAAQTQACVLILDVRTELLTGAVRAIRKQGVWIVTIDDPSERRLVADLAFYPPVPQVERLDWSGFSGRCFVGWEWVPLRPEFAHARQLSKQRSIGPVASPLRILVTMGGSDPAGLTLLALQALDSLTGNFDVQVVLGGGFMHEKSLNDWLATARRTYTMERNVADMAALMAQADMAVASFGVTAYELAVVGIPALYLCLTQDHAESASALVKEGIALSLGNYRKINSARFADEIDLFCKNHSLRGRMREYAMQAIDGRGSIRIAGIIDKIAWGNK